MSIRRVFLAWGRIGRRTRELADILKARLTYIPGKPPYLRAWSETSRILSEISPRIVILQLPQGPLLLRAIMLKKKLGYTLVADVHTGFSIYESWKSLILNKPFHKLLKYCELVIAHNDTFREHLIKNKKIDPRKVITVYDPFPRIPEHLKKPANIDIESYEYVVFPATWDPDENLEYILKEYLSSTASKQYKLIITGNYHRRIKLANKIKRISDKIILTGFIKSEEYYWILKNSRLIITGTTREYTMLSSIWEAIALEKPFVTNYTQTLKNILEKNTLYYIYHEGSLKKLLDTCLRSRECIVDLQERIKVLKKKMLMLSKNSIEKLEKLIDKIDGLKKV